MKTNRLKWLAALSGLGAGLGVLLAAGPIQAASFAEIGDAGESLLNAASVTSEQSSPLELISGVLSGDVDLFKIFLTGNQQFSATTRNSDTDQIPIDLALGLPVDLVIDPQLFLFDALGKGVYANDDLFGSTQATLTSGGLSPLAAGIYFLGVSGSGLNPFSANGDIFPSDLFDQVVGATGPGGGTPLVGFEGDRVTSGGKYSIALTGAQTIAANPAVSVPEPAMTMGLLLLGAGLMVSQSRLLTTKFTH
jgi:hypothetical protein